MKRYATNLSILSTKAFLFFLAASISMLGFVSPARAVTFPDKNLEKAVRAQVFDKKNNDAELTEADLSKIFLLEAKGVGITDLTGLESCVNLELIDLERNQIANVAPLKDLKHLQSIDLSQNQIADAAPLAALPEVQYLRLADNRLTSIPDLQSSAHLTVLDLSGNKIYDLAPVAKFTKLSSLYLAKNLIIDLGPLANVTKLSLLSLSDNAIVDVAPLAKQGEIGVLMLDHNKIADLKPLVTAIEADAAAQKRIAPFLRLYLTGNPLCTNPDSGEQLTKLSGAGTRITN